MGVQTVSGIRDILNNYDAKNWTQSSKIDEFASELPALNSMELNPSSKGQTFGELLASSLGDVNKLQHEANIAVQKLVSGESKNLHETMLTVEKAEIAFKTMNQVRQKVIDAYKEVMRMQV